MMGNQNMLINLSLFAFLIYLAFSVVTRLSGTSLTTLIGIKSQYVTRQSQSDTGTGNRTDITHDLFSHLRVSLTPLPTSTLPYKYVKRINDQTSFQQNVSIILLDMEDKMKARNLSWNPDKLEAKTRAWNLDLKKQVAHITDKVQTPKSSQPCFKRILFWCEDSIGNLGENTCYQPHCKVKITRSVNVKDLQHADAVVFYHMIEKPWETLIRHRPLGQVWVFFSRESPYHCKYCMPPVSYMNVFNMSLTYLSDSDIVAPYGKFYPFKKIKKPKSINWAANKTKKVLWVASNCLAASWGRTKFVKHLASYTDVDIYGRCGTLSCPKEEREKCEKIFSQYKFYLALENSNCREYITEKVWHNSFERNVVPVVFGANREDYENILPPNSFIFAEDFNSTQDLANFLDKIDLNDTLYNDFFLWKRKGYIKRWTRSMTFTSKTFCKIVERLDGTQSVTGDGGTIHRQNEMTSVEDWWRSSCFKRTHLNFADR